MDVTVIIPCLNEEAYLGGLLKNLNEQTKKPRAIVVADCDSTDKTRDIAKRFQTKIPIKVVKAPIKSAASARNAGAKAAKTKYLLFVDADTRLPKDFIKALAAKKNIDFVSPHFVSDSWHPFDFFNVLAIDAWMMWLIYVRKRPIGIGPALLVKKSAHDAVGGFDDHVREFDDIAYSQKFGPEYTFDFAWKAKAVFSHRRAIRQGRLKTAMQQLPDNYLFVRKVVRPTMRRAGVSKKFED